MESYRKLDAPRPAQIQRAIILVILLLTTCTAFAQSSDLVARLQSLLKEERWAEIVEMLKGTPERSAEIDYIGGIALAKLGRTEEARTAFMDGRSRASRDARFPTELAGLAFQQKRYDKSLHWLRIASRLAPSDDYVSDFTGTVYFLQGNLEAALKFWNRVGKPMIHAVRPEPSLRLDPVLFDHAITFAPGEKLSSENLILSEARLRALGVFPVLRPELQARPDGKYDFVYHAKESNGFGANKWVSLLNTFRGVIFETVTPEYYNIGGSATNVVSLYRWDKNKRRALAAVDGPLHRNPRWHYRLLFDFRNENWTVENFSSVPGHSLGGLNFRREAVAGEIVSIQTARWNWSTGAEFSNRDYRDIAVDPSLPQELFLGGKQLKHYARLNYNLVRIPERRFTIASSVATQEGRTWNALDPTFAKVQLNLKQHWFPQSSGEDYETQTQVRYGRTYGTVPFDELFMLGIERDNDLLMRAHVGADDGKKGTAPLGRNYFLTNFEFDKNLYGNNLFRLTLGPFVDTGKITDPVAALGTRKWLVDAGAQLKVKTFGMRFALTYGKDLRTGNNEYYIYLTQ